jgi:hypothetical protein
VLAAVDGFGVEAGLFCNVDEGDAEWGSCHWRGWTFGCGARLRIIGWARANGRGLRRLGEGEDVFEREDESGAGERGEECAAGPGQLEFSLWPLVLRDLLQSERTWLRLG